MYITGHRWTNPIDLGEYRMNSFFYRNTKGYCYTVRPMEPTSLKCSSIQTVHWIELKFGMCVTSHRPTYCVDFDEFRLNNVFTSVPKRILLHYSLWSEIIRSILAYLKWFRVNSNLECQRKGSRKKRSPKKGSPEKRVLRIAKHIMYIYNPKFSHYSRDL